MRAITVFCLAIALMGCEARSKNDLQQQALKAYVSCLHRAARALDDHRSDASVIAEAVAEKCSSEHDAAVTLLSYAPQAISAATTIVLDERNRNPN